VSSIRKSKVDSKEVCSKASLMLLTLLGAVAPASDVSAQVVAGDAVTQVETSGDRFDITGGQLSDDRANLFQSFQQFDVSAAQTANFVTPTEVQNVISRISSDQASTIDGTLQVSGSEANLYLMNPAGILMGPNAQLNLSGGFTATTATSIGFEKGFWAGFGAGSDYPTALPSGDPTALRFEGDQAGAVVNLGDLSVAEGQSITLVGGTVVNAGNLSAPAGTITLAAVAGENLVRIRQGEQLLSLEVATSDLALDTDHSVTPQRIGEMLTGGNLTSAAALTTHPDGTVRLGNATISEQGGSAIASGQLSTRSTISGNGGNINVLGDRVTLVGANLDASGSHGGGLIRVGGDYQGKGPVINAEQTLVDAASTLSANALESGDGGRIIIWADELTEFDGSLYAQGGAVSGNGGFAEVSGKARLAFGGSANLSAAQGDFGKLLLDPENWVITDGPAPLSNLTTSYLSSTFVEALSIFSDIELAATRDITIENLSDDQLTIYPDRSVTFIADSDGTNGGAFRMNLGDTIRAERGRVSISGAGITAGIIDTSTTEDNGTGSDGIAGGSVDLLSSQGITASRISTFGSLTGQSQQAADGGSVTVEAQNGDIDIASEIKTGSFNTQNNAGLGGDITLRSLNGAVEVGSLNSSSIAQGNNASDAGSITINASDEFISSGDILAYSFAGSNNSGHGNTVSISANSVTARSINTRSEGTGNNARDGGDVSISANSNIDVTGPISTLSIAGNNNAGDGGNIEITGDYVHLGTLLSQSRANNNAGQAGRITVTAADELTVSKILANSVGGGSSANISLTGDKIDLIGGDNSVAGDRVQLRPSSLSRNINIGNGSGTTALDIQQRDLAAIGNNASGIEIGNAAGTGTVRLFASAIDSASSRPLIDIVGGRSLIGPNLETTFRITRTDAGDLLNSKIAFSNIENLAGGLEDDRFQFINNGALTGELNGSTGYDTLDYSGYSTAVEVDFDNMRATGLAAFLNLENIVGSAANSDLIRGADGNDNFVITGDRNGTLNGTISFSEIEVLNGQGGINTFRLDGLTAGSRFTLIGGSDLSASQSNNRIVTDAANTTWSLDGKNQGELRQGNTTLAAFSEIQHLENTSTAGGEHSVFFTEPSSQITGSISSGSSDLTLVGNDINLGHSNGAGDNQNALITGSGRLTIRPESDDVGIELGGMDTQGPQTLNITEGELAAIQDGFIDITIGDANLTGEITLGGDALFRDAVTLRSQGNIDTTGSELTGSSSITLQTEGAIRSGTIETEGSEITLLAQQNIDAGSIFTSGSAEGQGISLTSTGGGVTVAGTINSSGSQVGNDVTIAAQSDISIGGEIETTGRDRGGDINIASANGGITASGLTTANRDNGGSLALKPGSVKLRSPGSIQIEFIDARGTNNVEEGNLVEVDTQAAFAATNSDLGASISTRSTGRARGGGVTISYGNSSRPATDYAFTVGASAGNGTASNIETPATAIASGNFVSSYSQANIQLINNGLPPLLLEPSPAEPAPVYPSPTLLPPPPTANIAAETSMAYSWTLPYGIGAVESQSIASVFQQIEAGGSERFNEYLGVTAQGKPIATLETVQKTLENVSSATGVEPAVLYVYFVPDAAEAASEQAPRPSDQLEVMLLTRSGEPIRRRQWGITREQVEAVGHELRQQTTSQFSTVRQYLPPAQQLYNWMIAPVVQTLEEEGVTSLGFVMEAGVRTLPLAALNDGDRYLVENYSLGLLPTFSLTDFASAEADRRAFNTAQVLAMGASEFEDQPDLPAVAAEVNLIANQLSTGEAFLNEDFVLSNLQTQLQTKNYDVVHLATHAVFESGSLEDSYIQLWDQQLSLNELTSLNIQDANIGLIVLSACSTALGDQASEYGFAGFAVSAGSQSALASLWPVNDEGTLGFMSQFYTQLRDSTVRAEALRQAQISLIEGQVSIADGIVYGPNEAEIATIPELAESGRWNFSHPFYWSAFTMIGNPW
jgi:filamentous hemagglutinin family protein